MTLTTTTRTSTDDVLAEAAGDAALVALLRSKPTSDPVPTAVWWLVAEAIRSSVGVRRELARGGQPNAELAGLGIEAELLTEAAIAELADATSVRPRPVLVDQRGRVSAVLRLQRSILGLARLLVGHRATPADRLAAALAQHQRSLVDAQSATGTGANRSSMTSSPAAISVAARS
jgi:hypothetical protein